MKEDTGQTRQEIAFRWLGGKLLQLAWLPSLLFLLSDMRWRELTRIEISYQGMYKYFVCLRGNLGWFSIFNLWWILWCGSEVYWLCRDSLWSLYRQIPPVCSNREDPTPGLLSRLQASVSPPTEWSRGSLRSGVRNHQHSHPVNLWRHGDPAHRDQVGLRPEEGGLLHQPLP